MALKNPGGLALEDGNNQWTYEVLDRLVEERASQLFRLGGGPGVNVLLASQVTVEAVEMVHSVLRTGSTLLPINPLLGLQEEIVDKANPGIILVSKELENIFQPFLGSCVDRSGLFPGLESMGIWVSENVSGLKSDQASRSTNFPAALILTSGTEGKPKAIPVMSEALEHSACAVRSRLGLSTEDRWYASLSLGHVGGLALIHRTAFIGSTLLVRERFSTEGLVEVIETKRVSHTSVVPTMLNKILQIRGDKKAPPDLEALVVGGASTDAALLGKALSLGYPIVTTYGMTESCSQISTAPVELVKKKPGTVGAPIHGLEIKIGEDCEICVRGPTVADCVTDREGWFATGDLGEIDDDGHLWIRGRQKDIIITGGVNVDPVKVSNEIRCVPGVVEAVVVGLPHEVWGETVGALVVLESHGSMKESAMLKILSDRLSKPELPRMISFGTEIPTSANGKTDFEAVHLILSRFSSRVS